MEGFGFEIKYFWLEWKKKKKEKNKVFSFEGGGWVYILFYILFFLFLVYLLF